MQLRTERKAPQRYRDDEVKTVVPAPNMARSLDSPWKMPPPVQFNPNLPPATLATLELGVLRPSIITNAEPGERHHSNQPQRHTSFESSHDSARIRTVERHQDSHPGSDDTYDGINPISPAVSEAMGFVAVPASEREVQWHMLAMPLRCQILLSMRGEPMGETDLAIRTRFSGQQIDEACASLLDIEFVFDPRKIRSVLADDALKISISELDEVKAWMLRYSQREIQETSALTRFRKETLNILLNYTGDTIPANYFRGLLEKHTGRFRRQESNLVTQHELLQAQLFLGERGLNPTWAGQWTIPSAGRTLYSLETALSESPLLQHDETAYPKVATRNRDSSARPWTSNTSSREASQPEELSEGHAASNPNEDVIGDDGTDSQSAQAIYQTARESVKQTETIEDAFSLRNSLLVNASVASSTRTPGIKSRPKRARSVSVTKLLSKLYKSFDAQNVPETPRSVSVPTMEGNLQPGVSSRAITPQTPLNSSPPGQVGIDSPTFKFSNALPRLKRKFTRSPSRSPTKQPSPDVAHAPETSNGQDSSGTTARIDTPDPAITTTPVPVPIVQPAPAPATPDPDTITLAQNPSGPMDTGRLSTPPPDTTGTPSRYLSPGSFLSASPKRRGRPKGSKNKTKSVKNGKRKVSDSKRST